MAVHLQEKYATRSGYQLRHLRGRGSFGTVWEAESADGRPVAFKCIACKPGIATYELRNTTRVAQIRHPNLVAIDRVWCEEDHLIYVMELADGSLQDLYEISKGEFGVHLPAHWVCAYFRQAAEGIDFLNARQHQIGGVRVGIQHCDIKPSNLLLFGEQVKLCDFGMATVLAASFVRSQVGGTPAYAAPEVFQGCLSSWTDQYALAVSYCELRGGRWPFADTPSEFDRDYLRPNPDLTMLDPAERPIIARALTPVPQDRWPSCADMVRQLAALTAKARLPRAERRQNGTRYECPHRPSLRLVRRENQCNIKARVVNLSRLGLGLLVDRPLGVGQEVLFLAPSVNDEEPRLLSAKVVRVVHEPDGSLFAGCRLTFSFTLEEVEELRKPRKSGSFSQAGG